MYGAARPRRYKDALEAIYKQHEDRQKERVRAIKAGAGQSSIAERVKQVCGPLLTRRPAAPQVSGRAPASKRGLGRPARPVAVQGCKPLRALGRTASVLTRLALIRSC